MKKTAVFLIAIAVIGLSRLIGASFVVGNQTIGASLDAGDSAYLNGSRVTISASGGTVISMSVYVGAVDASPNNQYQLAVYADSGGKPAALAGTSVVGTLTANAWNTVPFATTSTLSAGASYWLVFNTNGRTQAVNNLRYGAGAAGGGVYSSGSVAFGTWPSSFGSSVLTNASYSIYATLDTSTGPPIETLLGSWSPVATWPIVAVHANVLRTGKVLVWDEEVNITHPRVWNPATGTLTTTPNVGVELWCAGNIGLMNGKVLLAGGHKPQDGEAGINATYQYDPGANTWTKTANLADARWYPTLTALNDGRIAIISGQITPGVFADIPEIYTPATGKLTSLSSVRTRELREEEYPSDFLLPNGKVLAISNEWGPVQLLDVGTSSWTHVTTTPIILGSAVQYRPGKILMSGGAGGFLLPADTDAAVLDMNVTSPGWRQTASMSFGRYMHTMVMLPTGKVLAVGGAGTTDERNSTGPLPIELWDPDTELWTTLAPLSVPRYYHSIAVLLPDGRVLAAGGGHNSGYLIDNFNAQVYSPPYLFKGARPVIMTAPDTITYGSTFAVSTAQATSIASVSLIDLPSVTHGTPMGQIYRELAFTKGTGQLTVTAPASGNQVPPGYYMMFIVDTNGVPSVAKILSVAGAAPPPPPGAIGLASVGAEQDSGDNNYLNGSVVTAPSSGHIVTASVYTGPIDSAAANRLYQVALYTDSGGHPGTLVLASASATLAANGWNTVALNATVQANTKYWLIYNSNGRSSDVNEMYFNTAGAGQGVYSANAVTFGTWPAAFPGHVLTSSQFSLYGTMGP